MSWLIDLKADPRKWLGYLRVVYSVNIIDLLWHYTATGAGDFPQELLKPLFLFQGWDLPQNMFSVKVVATVLLGLHALGLGGQWMAAAASVPVTIAFGLRYNFGYVHFADSLVPLTLIAAAMSPVISSQRSGEDVRAHIFVMRATLIIPFFSGAINKLRLVGWSWASAAFQRSLFDFDREMFSDWLSPERRDLLSAFAARPWLLNFAGIFVLAVELLSPLAFVARGAALVLIPSLLLLHLGFIFVFAHDFLRYCWPLYLYWIPWEKWTRDTSPNPPP